MAAAARKLGAPKSSMTRQLARLEERLGCRLIARTTRSVSLTDEGRTFLPYARRLVDDSREAVSVVQSRRGRASGLLKVSSPGAFGRRFLAPHLAAFRKRNPEVRVALELTARKVELTPEGAEIAIRLGPLVDPGLGGPPPRPARVLPRGGARLSEKTPRAEKPRRPRRPRFHRASPAARRRADRTASRTRERFRIGVSRLRDRRSRRGAGDSFARAAESPRCRAFSSPMRSAPARSASSCPAGRRKRRKSPPSIPRSPRRRCGSASISIFCAIRSARESRGRRGRKEASWQPWSRDTKAYV